jgi:hypothetical protein
MFDHHLQHHGPMTAMIETVNRRFCLILRLPRAGFPRALSS